MAEYWRAAIALTFYSMTMDCHSEIRETGRETEIFIKFDTSHSAEALCRTSTVIGGRNVRKLRIDPSLSSKQMTVDRQMLIAIFD